MIIFFLKKKISFFLNPIPFSSIGLLISSLLLFFPATARIARMLIIFFILYLWATSIGFTSNLLLRHLESQYPPLQPPYSDAHLIVELTGRPSRLIYAIKLYHSLSAEHKHPTLILSGGNAYGRGLYQANERKKRAIALGVKEQDISLETSSLDTAEQAQLLKPLLKDQSFYLVTSAFHMPRSVFLFKQQGLEPITAPCHFMANNTISLRSFIPSQTALNQSEVALHEYFGLIWAYLRQYLLR